MFKSNARCYKDKSKEKAVFDYIMADLIGKSVARIYDNKLQYPDISEVYPQLFDSVAIQEQKQEKADELSAIRFKLFAESFNKKFKEGAANSE